jgi:hypothetical protein
LAQGDRKILEEKKRSKALFWLKKKVFYPKNDLNVYDIISINLKFILSTNSSTRILISYSTFHRKAPNYFFSSIFNRDTIEITWRFALLCVLREENKALCDAKVYYI